MAFTKNTIKDRSHRDGRGRFQFAALSLAVAVAGLGLCLSLTALPRFWAAGYRLPANGVLYRLANGHTVSDPQLRRAELALEDSLIVRTESQTLNDLALINLQQALQSDLDDARAAALLKVSAERQRQALARNPSNAFGWLRLTHLALLESGPGKGRESGAVAALLRSRAQSPFYVWIVWRQLEFALLLWPVLQPPERNIMQPLILSAAKISLWRLAKMAEQRHAVVGVREALAPHAALLAEFDRHYLQRIRP